MSTHNHCSVYSHSLSFIPPLYDTVVRSHFPLTPSVFCSPSTVHHRWRCKSARLPALAEPVEHLPALAKPVENIPALANPVEHIPALANPVGRLPALADPVEHTPALENTVEHIPALASPVEHKGIQIADKRARG